MSKAVFSNWREAHTEAVKYARTLGCDVGLEKAKEFGHTVFRIFALPRPENRYGHELRCEVVKPNDPL